jgi:hypothetical protein
MKKFLMICMLFSLAACSGNKEENKDVAAKKVELEKLTKERDAIVAKIAAHIVSAARTNRRDELTRVISTQFFIDLTSFPG